MVRGARVVPPLPVLVVDPGEPVSRAARAVLVVVAHACELYQGVGASHEIDHLNRDRRRVDRSGELISHVVLPEAWGGRDRAVRVRLPLIVHIEQLASPVAW